MQKFPIFYVEKWIENDFTESTFHLRHNLRLCGTISEINFNTLFLVCIYYEVSVCLLVVCLYVYKTMHPINSFPFVFSTLASHSHEFSERQIPFTAISLQNPFYECFLCVCLE